MKDLICEAIQGRNLLQFNYKGYDRIVEPHACGILSTGNNAIRCYQVDGGSDSGNPTGWKLMLIDEIGNLTKLEETFQSPRSGYRRGDSKMIKIFCEL